MVQLQGIWHRSAGGTVTGRCSHSRVSLTPYLSKGFIPTCVGQLAVKPSAPNVLDFQRAMCLQQSEGQLAVNQMSLICSICLCIHLYLTATETVETSGAVPSLVHRAVDTSGCGHIRLWTHQTVDTSSGCGHIRLWTHQTVDTSGCGHIGL